MGRHGEPDRLALLLKSARWTLHDIDVLMVANMDHRWKVTQCSLYVLERRDRFGGFLFKLVWRLMAVHTTRIREKQKFEKNGIPHHHSESVKERKKTLEALSKSGQQRSFFSL